MDLEDEAAAWVQVDAGLDVGGGVVGDMGGFAAACYQRGIDFAQVPTTLLAQVDSSVGGKTGVNHPGGKNLIGAFHQPIAVIADTRTLDTLPDRELRAGLAEVIKYGLICDEPFFAWLEQHAEALLARFERFGRVLRVAPNRFFLPETVAALAREAASLAEPDGFTAADYNRRTGIGRNVTIEVLEFLDALGLTRRTGELRHMLGDPEEVLGVIPP